MYEPQASAILGLCFFRRATLREDTENHGDLVFEVDKAVVGVRVQDARWWDKHGDHLTFRDRTQSGKRTEYARIKKGKGPDFFLSAFRNTDDADSIGRWILFDVLQIRCVLTAIPIHGPFQNGDGSSLVRIHADDLHQGAVRNSGFGLTRDIR